MKLKFNDLINMPLSNIYAIRELELVLNYLNLDKDDHLLDIGCGSGRVCFMASKYVKKVVGADISKVVINFLNEKPKPDNVEFYVMDATKEPPDVFLNRFDKCICIDVLEHVGDPKMFLEFISKILKVGGGCLT